MVAFEQVEQWPTLPFKFYQNDPNKPIDFPAHWHPSIELNFLVSGGPLTFTTDGVEHIYLPGDVWATDRRVIHSNSGDPTLNWDEFGLIIDEDFLAAKLPSSANWQLHLIGHPDHQTHAYRELFEHGLAIRDLINQGVDEYRRLEILSHFYALLVDLGRNFTTERHDPQVAHNGHLVDQVMQLIHAQFAKNLHSSALAQAVHVSTTTLNQQFQAQVHMSVHQYIRLVRLIKARRLLLESDAPIDFIAVTCGFGSTKSFQRNFKTFSGLTPSKYRQTVHTLPPDDLAFLHDDH